MHGSRRCRGGVWPLPLRAQRSGCPGPGGRSTFEAPRSPHPLLERPGPFHLDLRPIGTRTRSGGPTWTRTKTGPVMSRGLCQLSYGPGRHDNTGSGLEEAPELLGTRRMAEFAQRLRFDLADALSRDGKILADLLEGVLAAVGQPEAESQHLLLARRQRVEHLVGLLAEAQADHALDRRAHLLVLDEVAQMAVLLFADRGLEGDRRLRDLEDLADLVHRHFHLHGDLLRRRFAPELLDELARGADELVDGLDHVHRNADGPGLVRDGAGDGLADPPGRI